MSSTDVPVLLSAPSAPPRGIVVVLHDVFGLSSYIRHVVAGLADAGWWAVAPALFHRDGVTAVPYDDLETGTHATRSLTKRGVLDDVDSAIAQAVRAGAAADTGVAVIGFCLGGSLGTFLASERRLTSCVNFYGGIVSGEGVDIPSIDELVPSVAAPWLCIYGESDPFIPNDDVEVLRAGLPRCPARASLSTYPGGHAFHRFTTPDYYHETSAAAAWAEATRWLDDHAGVHG